MSVSRLSLRWLALAAWVVAVLLLALGGTPGATAGQEPTPPAAPTLSEAEAEAQAQELMLLYQTAALQQMNVKEYHDAGKKGAGIKIAVIDVGYAGLQDRINEGELPADVVRLTYDLDTRTWTDGVGDGKTGCDEPIPHGTAAAEVIYDIAPEAKLYLVQLKGEADDSLRQLFERLRDEGVRIASMSLSFGIWRGDGTGPGYDLFEDVRRDYNILLVESAGNAAQTNYIADFRDGDGNARHEFNAAGDETNDITLGYCHDIVAYLTWDTWGGGAAGRQDYELVLTNALGVVVARSAPDPLHPDAPREVLNYTHNPLIHLPLFGRLRIERQTDGNAARPVHLQVWGVHSLQFRNPADGASSLSAYGDSPHIFAVGAADVKDATLEEYSSRGPTTDNHEKPDITGYAMVNTASYWDYENRAFAGTSAAAPHVAGAAALLLQTNPGATADQLAALLSSTAEDKGDSGKDSLWGAGLLRLPYLQLNLTILAPTTAAPDAVGDPAAPVKTLIEVAVATGGGAPWGGLRAADFSVTVGGRPATVTTARQLSDRYVLEIAPPAQSAPGVYDLVVSHAGQSATQADALNYAAVGANRADVMLILDRSGSMSGAPLTAAKGAATQFVGLMQTGDAVGVGSYDDTAQLNYPLTPISDEAIKTAAQSTINAIVAGNLTSIGAGMVTGRDQLLSRGASEHAWAIVLLSDGQQNAAPWVDDVLPTITATKIKLFTIGLGNVDEPLMSRMAQETGGSYYYAPDPTGLARIYNSIAGEVAGRQTLYSRTAAVNAGDTASFLARVDSSVREAIFAINWADAGNGLDLTLLDPNGRRIDPAAAATDPVVDFVSGATYAYYVVRQPEPGEWTLEIAVAATTRAGDEPVMFDISVQGVADLTLELTAGVADHAAGDSVHLLLSLADDAPLAGAHVLVNVFRPDNGVDWFTLADDGQHNDGLADDGVYGGFYYRTDVAGTYRFLVQAFGHTGDEAYDRQAELSVAVAAATDADGDGMPDGWEIATGLNPLRNDATEDGDIDELANLDEFRRGTEPWVADTDADRLLDGAEVNTHQTDPRNADSDGGGISDGDEVDRGTDPLDWADDYGQPNSILLPAVMLQFTPTPTPTATPTPTPTPTVTPPPTCTNAVANPSFEENAVWQINANEFPAGYWWGFGHSGVRSMRIGINYANDNRYSYSSVEQAVRIPSPLASAKLGYWLYPQTSEPVAALTPPAVVPTSSQERAKLSDDAQMVLLLHGQGQQMVLRFMRQNPGRWVYYEHDLSAFRGQTVRLYFGVFNDGWGGITAMWADDVALNVCP